MVYVQPGTSPWKLAQKEYKTRRDWVGKVIHWEMCKLNVQIKCAN